MYIVRNAMYSSIGVADIWTCAGTLLKYIPLPLVPPGYTWLTGGTWGNYRETGSKKFLKVVTLVNLQR